MGSEMCIRDSNYRIDSSISALDVLEHALSRRLPFLAENDQLNSAREAGDAFEGFKEGEWEAAAPQTIFCISTLTFQFNP